MSVGPEAGLGVVVLGIWARPCDNRMSEVKGALFWMSHTADERQRRDWTEVSALVTEVMGHRSGSLIQASVSPILGPPPHFPWRLHCPLSPCGFQLLPCPPFCPRTLTLCFWRPDDVTLGSNPLSMPIASVTLGKLFSFSQCQCPYL